MERFTHLFPRPSTCHGDPRRTDQKPSAQKLTRVEFLLSTVILRRGDNGVAISVNRKGPFPPSKFVKVEKFELHLKYTLKT